MNIKIAFWIPFFIWLNNLIFFFKFKYSFYRLLDFASRHGRTPLPPTSYAPVRVQ